MHNFMKLHTNKYQQVPGIGMDSDRTPGRRVGLSEKPDPGRENEQP